MPNLSGIERLADRFAARVVEIFGYRMRRHIGLALQQRALAETADYVAENMATARQIDDPSDFLRVAASECTLSDGLVLECGVWKGRSLRVLAKLFPQRIYGFDSFAGLPEHWRADVPAGAFAVKELPRVPKNVDLVVGLFADTLPSFLAEHAGPMKFLHVDCDLYSSTVDVLNACADRLVPGTVIAFDEYLNYPGWREGEFKAWQEFAVSRAVRYEYLCYTLRHEQVTLRVLP